MQVYPSQMVADVQDELRDTLGRSATVAVIGKKLNRSLRDLSAEIRRVQPNAFKYFTQVNVVAGTSEYNLPIDIPPNGITEVLPLDGSVNLSKRYVRFNERGRYISGNTFYYSVRHNGRNLVLVIVPEPTQNETVTVWYTKEPTAMQYGTPGSMTATTIVLADPPTMGQRYLEASEPVNAYIMITAGNAIGDVRRITAYNVGTRVATVDSAWSNSLGNTRYEILPDWVSDQAADYLVWDVLRQEMSRNKDDKTDWDLARREKLDRILQQWQTLQRTEMHRIPLGRGYARTMLHRLPPDVDRGD